MSRFIRPMSAAVMPESLVVLPDTWVAEEKYDGHRIETIVHNADVVAYSKDGLIRLLPEHLLGALSTFPNGIYDGELFAPGRRSYGTTDKRFESELTYTVFDLLETGGEEVIEYEQQYRRELLTQVFTDANVQNQRAVVLANSWDIQSMDDVRARFAEVRARDGEGLILKRRVAPYQPGKRTKDFLKVKERRSAVLTCTGYVAAKLGPYAKVALVDDEGIRCVVKTRNGMERERLRAMPHYFIGRKMRIDYIERTPDRKYREPHWDRWEDE